MGDQVGFTAVSDLGEDCLRKIISKHCEEITGIREEQFEKMLLWRAMGLRMRLIEQRSDDGLKTTWTFEVDDAGQD